MNRASYAFAFIAIFMAMASVGIFAAAQAPKAQSSNRDTVDAAEAVAPSNYFPIWQKNEPNITDLVLIYCGGADRIEWTPELLAPYVSFKQRDTNEESWLFDGFLIMEYRDGRGHEYARGYKLQKSACREHWQWLLDRMFEPGRGVSALDRACANVAERIGRPIRPRQVVLTLPEPIFEQKDWGMLDGRKMDFSKVEDRAAACEWYVQAAIKKWRELAPKHLQLAGFYWVAEHNRRGYGVQPHVAKIVHAQDKRLFWIPYWDAKDAGNWRQLGFDAAYQQPNHFQLYEVPDSRLDDACKFARQHGMGMEIEFNHHVFDPGGKYRDRLLAYLDAYQRNDAKTNAAMAYYEEGGQLLRLASSKDGNMRQLYEKLASWVAARQRNADQLAREHTTHAFRLNKAR